MHYHPRAVGYAWMTIQCMSRSVYGIDANIYEPLQCPCGAEVDATEFPGLSRKGGTGRSAQHHSLNDLVWHGLLMANIPAAATKEPLGHLRSHGKRPDRLTVVPEEWQMRDLGYYLSLIHI